MLAGLLRDTGGGDALASAAGAPDVVPETSGLSGPAFGRYRLLEELGRGGMGVVYRALDTSLGREVALKTLPEGAAWSPALRERLLREARIASTLDHPGIVPIHEVGEVDGVPFFAMACVRGRTLAEVLLTDGPADPRGRAAMVHAAALAVAHAHERRVIHRDLKPSNILVEEGGRVLVADFGLARHLDQETRLTVRGELIGTVAYMPPEQLEGDVERMGPAADVYMLGAVLYEALTGHPPFTGTTMEEVAARSLTCDPRPPRESDSRIPLDLQTVCLKALRKEPTQRYPTACEFAADLGRYLAGLAVTARSETLPERAARWVRRRKAVAAWATVAGFSLAAAGGLAWQATRARAARAEAEARVVRELRSWTAYAVNATLRFRRAGGRIHGAEAEFLSPVEEATRRAIEQTPVLAEPHYHLGRLYRALLRFDDARVQQETALRKEPDYAPSLYEWAVLCAREAQNRRRTLREHAPAADPAGARDAASTRERDDALDQWNARTEEALVRLAGVVESGRSTPHPLPESPGAAAGRLALARGLLTLCRGGRPADAQPDLETAVRDDPTLEEAYEALVVVAAARRDWSTVVETCGRALEVDRGYVPHRLNRALALLSWGADPAARPEEAVARYDAAAADCAAALDLHPGYAHAHATRGLARFRAAMLARSTGADAESLFASSIDDLDRALKANPTSRFYAFQRGTTWMQLGLVRAQKGGDPRGCYRAAATALDDLREAGGGRTFCLNVRHSLACVLALWSGLPPAAGDRETTAAEDPGALRDRAFACLEEAVRFGWTDQRQWSQEPMLAPLREDPRWDRLFSGRRPK